MAREVLKGIKSENRLSKVRLIMPNDPVIGGQPSDNTDEFTSNTPLLDLACTLMYALAEIGRVDKKDIPKILDSLGDSRTAGASQRIVNEVNKLAKNAETAAGLANDKANQAKQDAYNADQKAVKAQTTADGADQKAVKAQTTADGADQKAVKAQTTADDAKKDVKDLNVQVTKNTKELERKVNVGDFGLASMSADTDIRDFKELPNINSTYTIAQVWTNGPLGDTAYSGIAETLVRRFRAGTEFIIRFHQGDDTYELRRKGGVWGEWRRTPTLKDLDDLVQVPVCEIFIFHTKDGIPPAGFIVRNGQPIDKTKMPKLYEEYGTNMPDDRNLAYRNAGDLTGAVGTRQEDAIQNITGALASNLGTYSSASGAFRVNSIENSWGGATTFIRNNQRAEFNASLVARTTEDDTRVKSRIIIGCNKIQ